MSVVTIRDVAKIAGVGVGTVSRVLNDSPSVSDATRNKVLSVIEALDYSPSSIARRLSHGRTMTIAVIASVFTRRSCVERLQGIEHVLTSSGYDLILYNVETLPRRDTCFRTVLRREGIDGWLVISIPPTEQEGDRIAEAGVPVVLVDAGHERLSTVQIDDRASARKATEHLIALGHRRIAYIGENLADNPFHARPMQDRFEGYCDALAAAAIPFNPDYHQQGRFGWRDARRMATDLLAMEERPTAIFAYSDSMAFGVLEAAQQCGVAVPDELSVIGFDDVELAQYFNLTTIRQPLYDTGARGAELLLELLENPETPTPQHIQLPTELVLRRTTARAAADRSVSLQSTQRPRRASTTNSAYSPPGGRSDL